MTIHYPQFLWALLGIVPIVAVFLVQFFRGRKALRSTGMELGAGETVYFLKWFGQTLFFVIFYAAMVFAIAEIHWGDEPLEEDRTNLDLVFLVDVSRSMNAQDLGTSRLDAAREFVLGLVQEFPSARYSLTAFKGNAVTLVPMTENPLAVEYALQYLSASLITSPGTNLELGLQRALASIPSGSDRHRLIVLLSDGEALTGSLESDAAGLDRLGVPILSVGFGTAEGGAIPIDDDTLLRHPQTGEVVLTKLDPGRLRRAAELSGGIYVNSSEPGSFTSTAAWIEEFVGTRQREGFRLSLIPRYGLFLNIALLSLALSLALRVVRIRGIL